MLSLAGKNELKSLKIEFNSVKCNSNMLGNSLDTAVVFSSKTAEDSIWAFRLAGRIYVRFKLEI